MATGAYSADEVRKRLNKEGFNCGKQTFLNILRNSFYSGIITVKPWKNEPEEKIQGLHIGLISETLFNEVQEILKGKNKKHPTNQQQHESLPLRSFLECPKCGNNLTGSGSIGRDKSKKHYYYHCQKGCSYRVKAGEANKAFENYLDQFTVSSEVCELYYVILKDIFLEQGKDREFKIQKLETDISQI